MIEVEITSWISFRQQSNQGFTQHFLGYGNNREALEPIINKTNIYS